MSNYPQLHVYKASAGSGKTFTLATQYISQLIIDPCAYAHILAVTFTNKATTEMKTRILEQLYGLAYRIPSSDKYLQELLKITGKNENEIRETASQALQNIIHDYSRFRVETIDSFFQSVMRNLARELELGNNLSIELNNGEVLSEAIDAMIEKLDIQSPVLGWILEYIEERIADDKRWNISNEIKRFGTNIFNEDYIKKGETLREKLTHPEFIPNYRKELNALRTASLQEMKEFSCRFLTILAENGLSTSDLKKGNNGIASYFNKLANGNLTNKIYTSTVKDCLEHKSNWYAKTSPKRNEIGDIAEKELIPLLTKAENARQVNNKIVNSCNLSLRYLNNLRLLNSIDNEVRVQNRLHNRFILSDTNALLHELIHKGDALFIYEKIGSFINTVMIDEFQDTSHLQWENFHLLLEDSLSQKDGSLIVGDIKQSIYRWRSGDWRILAELKNDKSLHISEHTLDTNWRSETRIIQFNNAIFRSACQFLCDCYQKETNQSCKILQEAYNDVCQKTAKKEEKGYVKITFLPNSQENPYEETTLEVLSDEIDSLIAQNVSPNDIAILVRKNKLIPVIADYFEKNTSYRIVSDEAFKLDASLAVRMMIDALYVLTSEESIIAKARLAINYQHEICKREIPLNDILSDKETYLPAGFTLQKDKLKFMPLYELLERLFSIFDMQKIKKQDAYLFAFYDAVTDYIQENSSELTAFLSYWEETLHDKNIPSGEIDGIRIFSIHKSKGLEFHTVLLPFCDWKMENEVQNHLLWCSLSETKEVSNIKPFNELNLIPINYSSLMNESIFRNNYIEERIQLWIDNLNLLYVAFTRACKNLIIIGQTEQSKTVSELLSQALLQIDSIPFQIASHDDSPEMPQRETTTSLSYIYGEIVPSQITIQKDSQNRLSQHAQTIPVSTETMQATVEFKQSNRSVRFIYHDEHESPKDQYIQQGLLLHNVFASIKKQSDLPRAIHRLYFDGIIESAEQEKQIYRLAQWALNNPQVQQWYDGSWEIYNECNILYLDTDGNMQSKRPDRVMIKKDKAIVVDFKFGMEKEEYVSQVQKYMKLLTEMGYKEVKGFLWYVFKNQLTEIF